MSKNTSYEVHTKKGGAWAICETFKGHEKGDDLDLVKEVFEEEVKIEAVKVVMEIEDEDERSFNDSVIFRDPRDMMTPRTEGGQGDKQEGGSSNKGGRSDDGSGGKNKTFGMRGFVFRFIGGVLSVLS